MQKWARSAVARNHQEEIQEKRVGASPHKILAVGTITPIADMELAPMS